MPKKKEKRKLPKPQDVPVVAPLVEKVAKRKGALAKVKAKATKDGKLNKYDPKYRQTLKQLKRMQRKLVKEIIRHPAPPKPAEAPAAAPAQ